MLSTDMPSVVVTSTCEFDHGDLFLTDNTAYWLLPVSPN